MTTQPTPKKLTVFILNLDKEQMWQNMFDSIYSNLIVSLDAKYHVQRARSLSGAQRYLNEHQPIAILLPDPAVTLEQNSALLGQVINYVQAGGFAIFACLFSSFITPPDMNKLWKTSWGLDWKFGNYHRTNVYLNKYVTYVPLTLSQWISINRVFSAFAKKRRHQPYTVAEVLPAKQLQPKGCFPQRRSECRFRVSSIFRLCHPESCFRP